MTDTETFNKWVFEKNLGTRFDPIPADIAEPFGLQLDRFNRRAADMRKYFKPGFDINIYGDFVNNGRCDACADIFHLLGLVAINKGAILLPLDVFRRIFSHPKTVEDVGDWPLERERPHHREGIIKNYDRLIASRKKSGVSLAARQPICEIRRFVANACTEIAWSFIVNHELIHIVHGHVDYLQKHYGTRQSPTRMQPQIGRPLSRCELDYLTLELWADAKAVSVVLGGLISKSNELPVSLMFPRLDQKLSLWAFAMYVLFRIWGISFELSDLENEDHPPSLIRFQMAMSVASIEVPERFPEITKNAFFEAIHSGHTAAEMALRCCRAPAFNRKDLILSLDPRVSEYLDRLSQHFEFVLMPELKSLSYIDLVDLDLAKPNVSVQTARPPQPQPQRPLAIVS